MRKRLVVTTRWKVSTAVGDTVTAGGCPADPFAGPAMIAVLLSRALSVDTQHVWRKIPIYFNGVNANTFQKCQCQVTLA